MVAGVVDAARKKQIEEMRGRRAEEKCMPYLKEVRFARRPPWHRWGWVWVSDYGKWMYTPVELRRRVLRDLGLQWGVRTLYRLRWHPRRLTAERWVKRLQRIQLWWPIYYCCVRFAKLPPKKTLEEFARGTLGAYGKK